MWHKLELVVPPSRLEVLLLLVRCPYSCYLPLFVINRALTFTEQPQQCLLLMLMSNFQHPSCTSPLDGRK